jgi:HEAT repeat protein
MGKILTLLVVSIVLMGGPALAEPPAPAQPAKQAKYKAQPPEFWGKKLQSEKKEDIEEATAAIFSLGTGAKPIVPILIELLDDHYPPYQLMAAQLLAVVDPTTADQAILPVLSKLVRKGLGEGRYEERVIASQALAFLRQRGANAVPALIELLGDSSSRVRYFTAETLGEMEEVARPAIAALEKCLNDKEADCRLYAAEALWKIAKHKSSVPTMIALLKADDEDTSYAALISLGKVGPEAKQAVPILLKLLADPNTNIGKKTYGTVVLRETLLSIDAEAAAKAGITKEH